MKKSNKLLSLGIGLLVFGILFQLLIKEAGLTNITAIDNGLFPFFVELLKCAGASFIVASFVPKSDNFSVLSERQRKECIQEILAYEEEVRDSNADITMFFSNFIDDLFDLCKNKYRADNKYIIDVHYDSVQSRLYAEITNEYKEYRIKGSLQEHFFAFYEDDAVTREIVFYDKANNIITIERELERTSDTIPEGFPIDNPFSKDKIAKIVKYYKLPEEVDENNFIRVERIITQYGIIGSNVFLLGIGVIHPCYGMDIHIHLHDGIKLLDKNTFGDFIPDTSNNQASIRLRSYDWMKSGLGVDFVFQKQVIN